MGESTRQSLGVSPLGQWPRSSKFNFGYIATRRLVVSNIFYFHPYLGKISNLTNIFQMG